LQTQTTDLLPDPPLRPTDQSPIEHPSTLRNIFFGDEGLRAGWSILLFAALFAGFLFLANFVMHKFHHPIHTGAPDHTMSFFFMFLNESIPLVGVCLVTWIMSKVEHRPIGVYGLGGLSKVRHFIAGLAWGIICLSPFIFILWKAGFLVFDQRLLFGTDIFRYGAQWLLMFFAVGLLEEYFTRGYLQYTLTRGLAGIFQWLFKTPHSKALAFWTSAIIFSALFGFAHGSNPGESPIGLLTAAIASMMFCLVLWRTGSLWWAIGFHTTWDWGQSYLYGVADSGIMVQHHLLATHPVGKPLLSGGTTGPEGSVVILPIIVLIILVIIFTLPRTHAGYTRLLERPIES
jgi:membrane protease YdiL (CAAX protease family)